MAVKTQPQEQWKFLRHQLHQLGACHGVVPVPKESFLGNNGLSMQIHFYLQFHGCYLSI